MCELCLQHQSAPGIDTKTKNIHIEKEKEKLSWFGGTRLPRVVAASTATARDLPPPRTPARPPSVAVKIGCGKSGAAAAAAAAAVVVEPAAGSAANNAV